MTLKERGLAYELPAAQSGTITGDGGVEAPFLGQEWPFFWSSFSLLDGKQDGFVLRPKIESEPFFDIKKNKE